jgi:hypothetical protein
MLAHASAGWLSEGWVWGEGDIPGLVTQGDAVGVGVVEIVEVAELAGRQHQCVIAVDGVVADPGVERRQVGVPRVFEVGGQPPVQLGNIVSVDSWARSCGASRLAVVTSSLGHISTLSADIAGIVIARAQQVAGHLAAERIQSGAADGEPVVGSLTKERRSSP